METMAGSEAIIRDGRIQAEKGLSPILAEHARAAARSRRSKWAGGAYGRRGGHRYPLAKRAL